MKAIIYFASTIFLLSGCAAFNGTPERVINVDKTIAEYSSSLEGLITNPPNTCDDVKNNVSKALTAMDLRYAQFIDGISTESKTKATATDLALIGLGLAGTAVGGAGTKTILSAISTGVAAANTTIDKNFFYEKTIPSLTSQMNADRKLVLSTIVQRWKSCVDDTSTKNPSYSWFEAVHDLTEYYSAGTLLGAINSISKDAGAKQTLAEFDIQTALQLTRSQNTDDKAWLRGQIRNGKGQAIMACWQSTNPGLFKENTGPSPKSVCAQGTLSPARLINAAECAGDQPAVRKCLGG